MLGLSYWSTLIETVKPLLIFLDIAIILPRKKYLKDSQGLFGEVLQGHLWYVLDKCIIKILLYHD